MLVFTAVLLEGKPMPDLLKRVVIALIAHVALWDPLVSEYLARENLETIFAPTPLLQEIAKERGWDGGEEGLSLSGWPRGMQDMVDGTAKEHSALLAMRHDTRALQRRIWNAEVGVLLPFVEEQRQDILARFAGVLRVPFITRFGEEITDIRDLEIGHIESQLAKNPAVSNSIRQLITQLRIIRNALSHLESLDPALLLSGEVLSGLNGKGS
jgi:hypothetical protein